MLPLHIGMRGTRVGEASNPGPRSDDERSTSSDHDLYPRRPARLLSYNIGSLHRHLEEVLCVASEHHAQFIALQETGVTENQLPSLSFRLEPSKGVAEEDWRSSQESRSPLRFYIRLSARKASFFLSRISAPKSLGLFTAATAARPWMTVGCFLNFLPPFRSLDIGPGFVLVTGTTTLTTAAYKPLCKTLMAASLLLASINEALVLLTPSGPVVT